MLLHVIIIIGILFLGLNALRLFGSAIYICFTGKVGTSEKKLGWFGRSWNMLEAILIMVGFIALVIAYIKC